MHISMDQNGIQKPSMVMQQSYESCPMLLPGRKGARSAGCWDPENLVKLEEWGDHLGPV